MRKIIVLSMISLDGVIQAPGGPYRVGDFDIRHWAQAGTVGLGMLLNGALLAVAFGRVKLQ